MPEQWILDATGAETRPRRGFEDELAGELERQWGGHRRPWRPLAWAAAAVLLVLGVVAFATREGNGSVTPVGTTAAPVSTVATPSTAPHTVPPTTVPPSTTSTTATAPTSTPGRAFQGVNDYLQALAAGNYDAAATLLNEGGLELEARADIRPLFRPEFGLVPGHVDRAALAGALAKWCAQALCVPPSAVANVADGLWTRATFPYGDREFSALFRGFVFEGQQGVTGLPPMMPASHLESPAAAQAVVACPTEQVSGITWADLDGDGWIEELVAQIGVVPGVEGGAQKYTITTCGTMLQVPPFETTGDGLIVDAVSPGWVGPDYVLIGFSEGYPEGGIYAFDGQRIVQQQGVAGPAAFAVHPPVAGQDGESIGCAGVTPDLKPELVHHTYRMVGGSDLSNSTALQFTKVNVFGQRTLTENGTLTLPAQEQAAGEVVIGVCNGLPVLAN